MEILVQALDLLNKAGVVGLLVLILLGGYKRWWVFGWQYQSLEAAHNRWMDIALRGTDLAERATVVAASTTAAASTSVKK